LEAEVQLLSIALINILLLSTSPQMVILKALLWGGGLALLISCGFVLRWMVALERVPKWRFKRSGNLQKHALKSQPKSAMKEPLGKLSEILHFDRPPTLDSEDDVALAVQRVKPLSLRTDHKKPNGAPLDKEPTSAVSERPAEKLPSTAIQSPSQKELRRHTLPITRRSRTHTPSGRKKRSASSSLQGFYNLTETQATIRKYLYASYVYISVLLIILVGIREYIGRYALDGAEPVGWALAYMFGNIHWVRMQVLTLNLQRWIPLPERIRAVPVTLFQGPWIALLRENFGTANTRLLISGYWLLIIIAGLAIVTNLSSTVEVDTRRKVFHFMMVAMLLPATYIDPCFAALALALVLAIFLLLDLFRASQLPPLSKPLAHFLTPYIDGRDLRGPVVISHIFLLIGCAIPLWLSLGAVERENGGWEAPTRDVSMVSGVICVGMGDAAASLIGRRYGRHKWLWPGGKSLEGSAAFAVAVATALVAAKAWLRIGGWVDGGGASGTWTIVLGKAGVAAGMASATEAVLTGGNDNVVVPVVLWLCVKGLRI
jgi:dolichol kinase